MQTCFYRATLLHLTSIIISLVSFDEQEGIYHSAWVYDPLIVYGFSELSFYNKISLTFYQRIRRICLIRFKIIRRAYDPPKSLAFREPTFYTYLPLSILQLALMKKIILSTIVNLNFCFQIVHYPLNYSMPSAVSTMWFGNQMA